jgi:thiamine-phosphate pyrophosphorylase
VEPYLPKIYPITDTRLSGLSHAEQVAALIDGGASLIQIRDKYASAREFYDGAKAALEIASTHGARVIINDRVDIALALKADGVHLGQSDMPAVAARRLLGEAAIIGVSTHNLAQVELAATLPVDYVAFGPIFPTSTKEDSEPVAGLEEFRFVRARLGRLPLVAIGGITLANAARVLAAGADAVAVIAALVGESAKIAVNTRRMLAIAHN